MNNNKNLTNTNEQIKNALLNSLKEGTLNIDNLSNDLRQQVISILVEENIKKSRTDFHTYVSIMADEIISTGFIDGAHLRVISKHLMEVEQSIRDAYDKKIKHAKRKQFFLPPGAMKSLLISVLFVTWFLGRNPKFRVLQIGYSTDFAIDNFGRKVKDIIERSEKFHAIFPACKLKSDTRSAQRFELTAGGGYYAVGATAGIAGRRAHLLICDDVITEQSAFSDTERTKIVRWYIPGARSRLLPNYSEIIVNTRCHVDDLSAYLTKVDEKGRNPWEIISIPAILDKQSSKLLNHPEGTSYWPELYSTDYFLGQRDSYIAAGETARWSALFMQNPVPEEGNIVKKDYLSIWKKDEPPTCDLVIVSVDTAYETSKRSDYSAITVWGVFRTRSKGHNGVSIERPNIILLDAVRGKWELPELIEELHRINDEFSPDWFIIEKKSSGISVIQELRRQPDIPLFEYVPDKDKMSRLQSALPTMKSGCVWFPENMTFTEPVINELLQFPAGKNDDFVDTVSMVINWMRMNAVLLQPGERGYKDDDDDDNDYNNNNDYGYWTQIARRY